MKMDLFKVTAWGIDSRQPNPEMKVLCDEYCFAESAEAAFQKTFNSHPGQAAIKSIIDKSHKGELHYNIQKVELPSLKFRDDPVYINIPEIIIKVPGTVSIKPLPIIKNETAKTIAQPPSKADTKTQTPSAPHKGRRHKRSI